MGKVRADLTRGAAGKELVSERAVFPVALAAFSFFNFLIEAPCFPPSADLFWTRDTNTKLSISIQILYILKSKNRCYIKSER